MKAQKWLADHGFAVKSAQSENSNTSGGYLVPIELAGYIIQLMEEFGVFRKYANVKPMKGDTLNIPRRAGTISAYWLGDNAAITASAKTWDMVSLTAKKLAALIYFSNEIAEDAMVDIGDDLADELAWNFSYMEDNAGFNGTGTSATGGIIGLSGAFANAFGALTTIGKGGVKVGSAGSGGALSNLTLSDFTSMMGLLPDFAWKRGDPKWYVSKQLYYSTMVELLASGGGNTVLTLQQGPTRPQFLGADVVFVQVMPTAAAASVNYAYFGDLSLSSSLGDRKLLTIATSDQIGFPNDQLAIRGISRVDINNHDVGGNQANTLAQNPSYDQTGATYYSGPIVTLQSYNS
jgi:HK97 family phage major capsid protein